MIVSAFVILVFYTEVNALKEGKNSSYLTFLVYNFACLAQVFVVLVGVVYSQRGGDIFPVSCYLNVMIILDRSDSVKGGFNRSRDFVINVSDELNIGPHAHSVSCFELFFFLGGEGFGIPLLIYYFAKLFYILL